MRTTGRTAKGLLVQLVVNAISLGGLVGRQSHRLAAASRSCRIRSRADAVRSAALTGRSTRLPLLSPYENSRFR